MIVIFLFQALKDGKPTQTKLSVKGETLCCFETHNIIIRFGEPGCLDSNLTKRPVLCCFVKWITLSSLSLRIFRVGLL